MNINILKEKNRPGILGANITKNLKNQYSKRSLRVIKGDAVRILRGEYKGIEGKIEKVNTKRGTVSIEGVTKRKNKGRQCESANSCFKCSNNFSRNG